MPVLEHLSDVLTRCWRAALGAALPKRRFVVTCASEPQAYGPTITFWPEPPTGSDQA